MPVRHGHGSHSSIRAGPGNLDQRSAGLFYADTTIILKHFCVAVAKYGEMLENKVEWLAPGATTTPYELCLMPSWVNGSHTLHVHLRGEATQSTQCSPLPPQTASNVTLTERAVRRRQLLHCKHGRPNPLCVPHRGVLLLAGVPHHGHERRSGQVREVCPPLVRTVLTVVVWERRSFLAKPGRRTAMFCRRSRLI